MTTLGQKMREQEVARKQKTKAEQEAKDLAARRKAEKDVRDFTEFLHEVMTIVISRVESDLPVRSIRVPDRWYDYQNNIDSPRHNMYPVWNRVIVPWLKENDLKARVVMDHDGVGIHSWGVIYIEPADEGV